MPIQPSRPAPDQEAQKVEQLVRAEQVEVVYHQAIAAMLISITVAALLCRILWGVTDAPVLLGWFGAIVLLALIRGAVVFLYWRTSPAGTDVLVWERPFIVSLLLSATVWGAGGLLIIPPHSPLHQAVVYFFLMGMTGGSAALYSAHLFGVSSTMLIILAPTTVWLFTRGELIPVGLALGGCIYVLSTIRSAKLFSFFRYRSTQLAYELQQARAEAERLARTDELTRLYNRRAFVELGTLMLGQAERYARPVSLIMLDIDHFKQVNDSRGHAAGDAALRHLADLMRAGTRETDVCGRLGGEEFAVLLPGAKLDDAITVAESLRRTLAASPVCYGETSFTVTASLGVAHGPTRLEDLLHAADKALYQAKSTGRDRVVTLP